VSDSRGGGASGFEHATGVLLQARLQSNTGLLSLGVSPGFLVGYQAKSFAIGLGLAAIRLSVSDPDDDGTSLSLLEFMPTAIFDVWKSKDGRTRANLVTSVGYARASVTSTMSSTSCVGTGPDACTTTQEESTLTATLIPFSVGFGGDYYLSRNFALGAEVGVQAMLLASAEEQNRGRTSSPDVSGGLQLAYGLIRATLLLGD